MYNVDFDELEANMSSGNWDGNARILSDAAKMLEGAGVDFIVIATNTMHKLVPQIEKEIKIPILHIADATANAIRRDGIKKVALLGTKFTMTQDFIKDKLKSAGLDVLFSDEKDIELVNDVIFNELCLGKVLDSSRREYQRIICLEDTYNWQGICISRQNMCNWSLKVHERLKPLETLLNSELKKTKLLMFDESPVEVLKVDSEELKAEYWDEDRYRKKADDLEDECRRNCYMWVVLGGTKEHPVFSYNFRWTRSGKNVLDFLEGYEGNVIQSDGYSGYNAAINYWNLSHPDHKIELLNCWVHARRGFADAVKATKSKHAAQAIKLFKDVFDNENRLRKLFDEVKISEAEFLERRVNDVKPHMDNLHSWLLEKKQKEMILDSSKTKEAVNYCLNRWENLENFIKYPEATFSTNAAERSVKSWVMARRNFLFSGSGNGARASCFILSLIETAKQNGIAPEDYLRCLFEKAPYAETENDWEKLLPWNIEITPYKIRGEWI